MFNVNCMVSTSFDPKFYCHTPQRSAIAPFGQEMQLYNKSSRTPLIQMVPRFSRAFAGANVHHCPGPIGGGGVSLRMPHKNRASSAFGFCISKVVAVDCAFHDFSWVFACEPNIFKHHRQCCSVSVRNDRYWMASAWETHKEKPPELLTRLHRLAAVRIFDPFYQEQHMFFESKRWHDPGQIFMARY